MKAGVIGQPFSGLHFIIHQSYILFVTLPILLLAGCIPVYVRLPPDNTTVSDRYTSRTTTESSNDPFKTEGFVGPVIINSLRFDSLASPLFFTHDNIRPDLLPTNDRVTYDGMIDNASGYILNCKCVSEVEIINNKLVMKHAHAGTSAGDRERTSLLWNGKHYRTSKGEYVVDVIIDSPKSMYRVLVIEPKVFDITPLQINDAGCIWIHVVGFDYMIQYLY